MDNDGNDSFWMRMIAVVLCATVAIGLYKEVPRIVDSMRQKQAAKSLPQECRRNITMPNSFVIVYVRDSPARPNAPVGSGVLVSKTIAGKKRLMLVTARHVASAIVALRGRMEIGYMNDSNGIVRKPVQNRFWLIDGDRNDDLAVLDVTGEINRSSIDLDGDGPIKYATTDRFEELGIKTGSLAFAVCGNVGEENFAPRAGLYIGKFKPPSASEELCIFASDAIPGNSGSPMFVMVNEDIYFVGVFSAKTTANGKSYLGVVPLDRLMPLLGTKGMVYFTSDKEKLKADPR